MNPPDIGSLFEPRAVAVIGASHSPEKIGSRILDNIIQGGYKGKIYPINPKGGEIHGLPAYPSLAELPEPVDLACLAIPAKFTIPAVEECGKHGARNLAIITSGFSEVGNLEDERKILKIAHQNGMRILGPNIFGLYSAAVSLNATFGPRDITAGHVAIVTQSGALGIAMIGKTKVENIGLSSIISVGNKSDLDEADLLEYLIGDQRTRVILMYIEGIKHGARLVEILKRATRLKPIIVIKSGRSKRGAMAAASHTGSLAGADEIFSDIMEQCGVNRAESIQEALNWAKYLSISVAPKGENSVIVTNGGGIGVMAADACEKYNVKLYDDLAALEQIFCAEVPEFGSLKNPVDLTGQATLQIYEKSLNAAISRPEIDSIICLGCETAVLDVENLSTIVGRVSDLCADQKPIVFSFFGGEAIEKQVAGLRIAGRPIYGDVYEAVSCLGAAYRHYRNLNANLNGWGANTPDAQKIDFAAIQQIVDQVLAQNRKFLLSNEALKIAELAGLNIPRSRVAANLDQAVRYAEEIGYPVVMKIVSKDIVHKSDAGGVALDLENRQEVLDAYEAIMHNCKTRMPQARLEGVDISEMVHKGTETIIGARRDPSFGPVIMFGLGGIYVEVMKDVSFRALPLERHEARAMIKDIKSYPLLLGVRGESAKDVDGVIETILKVGAILLNVPAISDMEINPLVVYEQGSGVKAVDVRILLHGPVKGDADE